MRFGKIKKEATKLDLRELINILSLDRPQTEPNWQNIKKLENKFPNETFFDDFKNLSLTEKKGIIRSTLKELNCNEQDFTNFLSKRSFQAFNSYMVGQHVGIAMGGRGQYFFDDSVNDAGDGIITLWPMALFSSTGFRSLNIDYDDYLELLKNFFKIYNSKKKLTKLISEFVELHPNYSYFLPKGNDAPRFNNPTPPFWKKIIYFIAETSPILLIIGTIFYWNFEGPYWNFKEEDEWCQLEYDGYAWNLKADLAYWLKGFGTQGVELTINGNGLIPSFHNVPRFNYDPTPVTIASKKFWLVSAYPENITLALNENDEEGREAREDKSNDLEIEFLEALKLSNEIVITYRDFDTRKIKTGKMKFSPDGSAEAIDDFIYCVRKY